MYLEHFSLKEIPFAKTPRAEFFLNVASYDKVYRMLMLSIASRESIISVVGELGVGKTTLCREIFDALECSTEVNVPVLLDKPVLGPKDLLLALAEALGLNTDAEAGHHSLVKLITRELRELSEARKQIIILIDDAHAVPAKTFAALLMLIKSNTEVMRSSQLLLFAQPELNAKLQKNSFGQLRHSITYTSRREIFDRYAMERYIDHRMITAGHYGASIFSKDALDYLWESSQGNPRLVHSLCHRAMLAAYEKDDRIVEIAHARLAGENTEGTMEPNFSRISMLAASIGLITSVGLFCYIANFYY